VDWKKIYNERLSTAEQAVTYIKSGDKVCVSHAVGEPSHLIDALVENREVYNNVFITHMVPMDKCEYGDYIPCFFSQIPNLFDTDLLKLDVALVNVSPPDNHGFCSLGVSVDYTKYAADTAKLTIAQINKHMPRTLGDSFIHVSDIDVIVEHNEPIIELQPSMITHADKIIGECCASLINDGDCLQLGIGAIPDAVLLFLKDKKDLGIHSEVFSDGVVELFEDGVINNRKKTLHKNKMIASLLMGTKSLYDFANDNPCIEMHPVEYVNDPVIASKNDNLVSINSCVQVDLMGQVCSEIIGETQISDVGGQMDFVRAAAMSKGGRSIIAMNSTAAGGTISRIVPRLDVGACVTTSRNDVDYIVTEYGIAHLKYHTVRERARQLINISHPNFRMELIEAFESRFNDKF